MSELGTRRGGVRPPGLRVLSEWLARWMLRLYPPLLFQRVRVEEIGAGFRSCRVRVGRSLLNRNLNGTIFGGAIFCAADPIYALLYWQVFARRGVRLESWLKAASIRYRKPASTHVTLEFAIEDEDIEELAAQLGRTGRADRVHVTRAIDAHGDVCAEIETRVHLRYPSGS